jgi:hypothetical protein
MMGEAYPKCFEYIYSSSSYYNHMRIYYHLRTDEEMEAKQVKCFLKEESRFKYIKMPRFHSQRFLYNWVKVGSLGINITLKK